MKPKSDSSPSQGGNHSALQLSIDLPSPVVVLGAEIPISIVLKNVGAQPLDIASLRDNNIITNYLLYDGEQELIGQYNHVTRQQLLEKTETRSDDELALHLSPSDQETVVYNLSLLKWIEKPGRYFIRVRYVWQDYDILSEAKALEIAPAPVEAFNQQWRYHYGEKYLLHSAWVCKGIHEHHELYLRESHRFHPQVINFNTRISLSSPKASPRIAFEQSMLANGPVLLASLHEGKVDVFSVRGGDAPLHYEPVTLSARDGEWVSHPISNNGKFLGFIKGRDASGLATIDVFKHDGGGKLQDQRNFSLGETPFVRVVTDMDGDCRLIWFDPSARHVCVQTFNVNTLQCEGRVDNIWQSPNDRAFVEFILPPVLADELMFAAVLRPISAENSTTEEAPSFKTINIVWFSLDPEESNPVKEESFNIESTQALELVSAEMNAQAHAFLVLANEQNVHYLNSSLAQSMQVSDRKNISPLNSARLFINPRNDVIVNYGQLKTGIAAKWLHAGIDEDFDALDSVEDGD